MPELTKTDCEEGGLCCNSCQEDVNIHRCNKCDGRFEDAESMAKYLFPGWKVTNVREHKSD